MQDVNSPGRTQHNAKSINLEANILSEWSAASAVLHQEIRTRLVALIGVLFAAIVLIPMLYSSSVSARIKAASATTRNALDSRAVTDLGQRSKAAQPLTQETERLTESRTNLTSMLGNITLVVNAVPTSVAFDSVQAEVMDAELTLSCKSQAEDSDAGRMFVDAASKGPNVVYAVQASTMKSELLGKDGIAFDFIKRVRLER